MGLQPSSGLSCLYPCFQGVFNTTLPSGLIGEPKPSSKPSISNQGLSMQTTSYLHQSWGFCIVFSWAHCVLAFLSLDLFPRFTAEPVCTFCHSAASAAGEFLYCPSKAVLAPAGIFLLPTGLSISTENPGQTHFLQLSFTTALGSLSSFRKIICQQIRSAPSSS